MAPKDLGAITRKNKQSVRRRPEPDDSTASLDAENEDRFWTALDQLFPEVITIVATHRLATVERADKVLLLDRGRLVAIGEHHDLRRNIPGYKELLCLDDEAA